MISNVAIDDTLYTLYKCHDFRRPKQQFKTMKNPILFLRIFPQYSFPFSVCCQEPCDRGDKSNDGAGNRGHGIDQGLCPHDGWSKVRQKKSVAAWLDVRWPL